MSVTSYELLIRSMHHCVRLGAAGADAYIYILEWNIPICTWMTRIGRKPKSKKNLILGRSLQKYWAIGKSKKRRP